ncbi:serine/threonine-protein kinase [Herbiconiux sp. L3-i23]|uniref:serine/threonine-protein kinase n=1 Tax=Herbiconiux sp. L3-i23 TaxID=2905871 RepID=UPI00206FC75A|nr:serine/threonine-protein kinase [Herbiconiux sp. L3-i23]BDI23959.1 hypothetical protein L3i23_27350 [Herbiconiux sp. L3-i23]
MSAGPAPRLGRYELREVIGRGGLATVYSAHDSLLDREVAIKLFNADASSAELVRVQEAEARIAAQLSHFALTSLYDVGVESSDAGHPRIFLVMEHVRGGDLSGRLDQGPLRPNQLLSLAWDLASALEYIHGNGFVHRDLKPANVLITEDPANGRVRGKLTDFGITSILGAHAGQGTRKGTAAYISPEQVEGADPDLATDVYALGLVFLEALTGRIEFPGAMEQTAFARLERDPVIPDSVPPVVADLLRGMTHRQPALRPTMGVVLERIEAAAATLAAPIASAPTSDDPEKGRLAALRRYGVLDSPPDDALDHFTLLASRLFDAPISLLSFVDDERVWLKSHRGVAVQQVSRDAALCTLTVEGATAIAVPDISTDPRSADNTALRMTDAMAYAAAPLITHDGYAIGSLCVYDTRPRSFADDDLADLADLAALAMRELELRLAAREALFAA